MNSRAIHSLNVPQSRRPIPVIILFYWLITHFSCVRMLFSRMWFQTVFSDARVLYFSPSAQTQTYTQLLLRRQTGNHTTGNLNIFGCWFLSRDVGTLCGGGGQICCLGLLYSCYCSSNCLFTLKWIDPVLTLTFLDYRIDVIKRQLTPSYILLN